MSSPLLQQLRKDKPYFARFQKFYKTSDTASSEIDGEVMCCGEVAYAGIAKEIPKNRVIYDFGAGYGIQSYFFKNHKKYIAIEPFADEYFETDNAIWLKMTVQQFFEKFEVEEDAFAILNYVPDTEASKLVREKCKYLYVNYPTSGDANNILTKGGGECFREQYEKSKNKQYNNERNRK